MFEEESTLPLYAVECRGCVYDPLDVIRPALMCFDLYPSHRMPCLPVFVMSGLSFCLGSQRAHPLTHLPSVVHVPCIPTLAVRWRIRPCGCRISSEGGGVRVMPPSASFVPTNYKCLPSFSSWQWQRRHLSGLVPLFIPLDMGTIEACTACMACLPEHGNSNRLTFPLLVR